MDNFENNFKDLKNTVVCQAMDDYIKAKLAMEKSLYLLEELKDFFTGDGYELFGLDRISGEDIMKHCDEVVKKKFKKWRFYRHRKGME